MGKLVEHYAHCNFTPVDIQPYTHHSAISDAVTDSVGSDHSGTHYQARSRPHPESWQFDPWNGVVHFKSKRPGLKWGTIVIGDPEKYFFGDGDGAWVYSASPTIWWGE